MQTIVRNGKSYKYVNERNGYIAYRAGAGDEVIRKPDGSVIDAVLATDWIVVSSGGE